MQFGQVLFATESRALGEAQALANRHECPCGVWARARWCTACEVAPDLIEPDPPLEGWQLVATVDPNGGVDHGDGPSEDQ